MAVAAAGLAGAAAVGAVWEALVVVEQATVVRVLERAAAPLRAALRPGHEPTPPERRRLVLLLAACLLAAGWLLAGPLVGGLAAAAGPVAVAQVLAGRRRRWRAALADGAPAVARALGDALAGGHAIRGALAEVAAAGGAGPVADAELRAAAGALAVGARTEIVLERLRQRAGSPAWDTIVAATLLQRDAGGDLAGLLRGLAADLEAARRALADARAATAQARLTARLVAAMPVGAAVLAELADPGALGRIARHPLAGLLLGGALALEVVALIAVKRLTRLAGAA